MRHKVVFLASAEQDLKQLRAYLRTNFSPSSWSMTYAEIKQARQRLMTFPLSGSIPQELETLNLVQYRQVIVGMNRIIYEIRQETIYIHAIVDVRRDAPSLLMRRLLMNTGSR